MAKIPATIITGFLGAGKTTLIRNLLNNSEGRRIALIINEFGDLGVDGDLLKGCGDETCTDDDIMELSNGCICCTVAEDFVPTMEKLLERDNPPDHIVIETSGLALPQPLVRAFNWPGLSTRVTVDGVVTVVDGAAVAEGRFAHDTAAVDRQRAADENLDHETPLSELFEDQIACADMIVVNKADLLGEAGAEALTGKLKAEARSGVQVLQSTMGALPVDVLLGQGVGSEADLGARHEIHHHHHHDDDEDDHDHHHHHDHDDFEASSSPWAKWTILLPMQRKWPKRSAPMTSCGSRALSLLLANHCALPCRPSAPGSRTYFDKPHAGPRETRLVVIGQAGLDRSAIEAALAP